MTTSRGASRRGPAPRTGAGETAGWRSTLVRRPDGLRYWVTYDPRARDVITRMVAERRGHLVNDHLVRLMLALVRPGDVVLDLGAHIGTFALPAAAAGFRVVAVEADPTNVALLGASAARNRLRNLEVIGAAVAGRAGRVAFRPAGARGHVTTRTTRAESISVTAVRVDAILRGRDLDRIALVKMDVEGSEIRALRGMARLLSRADAPPLMYESNGHTLGFFGATTNELMAALERHGYASYLVDRRRVVRVSAGELQPQTVADCLAVKGGLPSLPGWRLAPGMTRDEQITRLLVDATLPVADHRRYVARALARAGPDLLSDRLIARTLDRLRDDPEPSVRAAASWWPHRTARERPP